MQSPDTTRTRPVNVLLVGTERMLLYTRKAILEKQHMEVSIVAPVDAVERLRGSEYDVVITCHTLHPEEIEQIAEAVKAEMHPPGWICYTKQAFPNAAPPSCKALVWSLSNPETLVKSVSAVLPPRANSRSL